MSTPPTTFAAAAPSTDAVYTVYGIGLASDHLFTYNLDVGSGSAELHFTMADVPPLAEGWLSSPVRYGAATPGFSSDRVGAVLVVDDCTVLRFPDVADFFLWDDRITAHLHDPVYHFAIELLLLGTVLTLWLELHGVPTLHAATVEVNGHAVGFLATNKGGKSSLAASFMQRGARLLGDDLLPLERRGDAYVGRPSYPQMRFWPEQAERLLGPDREWPRVQPGSPKMRIPVGPGGFGEFCREARPLAALYLPERDGSDRIEIEPLGYGEALTELVRHSFLAGVLETLGLAPARFRAFAQLLRGVPLRRLSYPSGIEHLGAVHAAVMRDIERTRGT